MIKFFQWLRTWLRGPDRTAGARVVQTRFKVRYWHFKSLLRLNAQALTLMAALEQGASSERAPNMAFIRGRLTSLSVQVIKVIKKLNEMSDNRYRELTPVFQRIQKSLGSLLAEPDMKQDLPLLRPVCSLRKNDAELVGAKMAVLGEIQSVLGIEVPDGFVITIRGDYLVMSDNRLQARIDQIFQEAEGDEPLDWLQIASVVQGLIQETPLPPELSAVLGRAALEFENKHGSEVRLAVRSSALEEDSAGNSFAGLYRTELNVAPADLEAAYKRVLAGKYSPEAMAYRNHRGLRDDTVKMSVGCLKMVRARVGGVIYSRDPMETDADRLVIEAVSGLGKGVVDGSKTPYRYLVARIRQPDWAVVQEPLLEEVPADKEYHTSRAPSLLSESCIKTLAELARRLEDHFGFPQDVEWALDEADQPVILQSRPLQPGSGFHDDDSWAGGPPEMSEVITQTVAPLVEGGVRVSRGSGAGIARHLIHPGDMQRFRAGDVLVLANPAIHWLRALPLAAAVISEVGGMAGHFATMTREFKVPAIFGVPGAMQCIPENTLVTVDAETCRVFPGKLEAILADGRALSIPSANETPLNRLLQDLLRHVTPLNLTDPEAVTFTPEDCRTLHDIIRFCHEKAMAELFAFGSRSSGLQAVGRRLNAGGPLQLWIIDLNEAVESDDSPAGTVTPKKHKGDNIWVHYDDIVSRPFRAIWEGMTAIPWEGPPAPDMKGFFSVMAESTMNRNLDPLAGSMSGDCAIITDNFCHLSLRWGYHFAVTQAYWGETERENYVRFNFQGGGADQERRRQRMALIRELLESYGFYTQAVKDTLSAKLEGYSSDVFAARLRLLGYLNLHTRQIDMIMGKPGRIKSLRKKMLNDCDAIVGGKTCVVTDPDN